MRILAVAEEMTPLLGFAPTLRMSGPLDERVPAGVGDQLPLVLREALSNAARHAKATEVEVTVEVGHDLLARVRDNGVGIPESVSRSGLANLSARAGQFGGTFRTGTSPSGGAEVEWRVPLA
jgi:signal transduction histidine kinase